MRIYIVYGSCGEYDDRRDWPVVAYKQQSQAEEHRQKAQAWYDTTFAKLCSESENIDIEYEINNMDKPFDQGSYMRTYAGVFYYVAEVELLDEVPN